MPQIGANSFGDAESTPVQHTFQPIGKDEKGIFWLEQSSPVVQFPPRFSISLKKSNLATSDGLGAAKCILQLWMPTGETIANTDAGYPATPKVAYRHVVRLEMTLPERGTKQERKNAVQIMMAALFNGQIVQVWQDLLPAY